VSFQSTIGIFDTPMPFKQPTEVEGCAVDVPPTLGNLLEPDGLAGPAAGDVHPLGIPPKAPVGTDGADFETVGVLKWRQLVRPLTRRGGLA
jgi:hypothetical protein